mmetsp:Transcript_26288/g.43043  ORF Transcript_26288/g.43043 Transcript_26288/m.43043 type:complete len:596 (-) Transcript_26288:1087-2874(-)
MPPLASTCSRIASPCDFAKIGLQTKKRPYKVLAFRLSGWWQRWPSGTSIALITDNEKEIIVSLKVPIVERKPYTGLKRLLSASSISEDCTVLGTEEFEIVFPYDKVTGANLQQPSPSAADLNPRGIFTIETSESPGYYKILDNRERERRTDLGKDVAQVMSSRVFVLEVDLNETRKPITTLLETLRDDALLLNRPLQIGLPHWTTYFHRAVLAHCYRWRIMTFTKRHWDSIFTAYLMFSLFVCCYQLYVSIPVLHEILRPAVNLLRRTVGGSLDNILLILRQYNFLLIGLLGPFHRMSLGLICIGNLVTETFHLLVSQVLGVCLICSPALNLVLEPLRDAVSASHQLLMFMYEGAVFVVAPLFSVLAQCVSTVWWIIKIIMQVLVGPLEFMIGELPFYGWFAWIKECSAVYQRSTEWLTAVLLRPALYLPVKPMTFFRDLIRNIALLFSSLWFHLKKICMQFIAVNLWRRWTLKHGGTSSSTSTPDKALTIPRSRSAGASVGVRDDDDDLVVPVASTSARHRSYWSRSSSSSTAISRSRSWSPSPSKKELSNNVTMTKSTIATSPIAKTSLLPLDLSDSGSPRGPDLLFGEHHHS